MLISSARLYVHKNVKIAYICIMYILVWPHNGVKSFLEEHSYFSASVFCWFYLTSFLTPNGELTIFSRVLKVS